MKIPCATRLPFVVSGLSFLQPVLTNSQFYNLTLIATALVLDGLVKSPNILFWPQHIVYTHASLPNMLW